jgi:hypothetical protein
MRTPTYEVNNLDWTEVASGATSVTVQLLSNGPVYLIATDATGFEAYPAPNERGMMMSRTGPDPVAISVNDIPKGGTVWLRSTQSDESNTVAVLTVGEVDFGGGGFGGGSGGDGSGNDGPIGDAG